MDPPRPAPDPGLTTSLVRDGTTETLQGRGRLNGAQGRTNGMVNGLGRTNGLTNGLRGRTNGLTNGLGRTNGLTNGLATGVRRPSSGHGYVNGIRLRGNQVGIVYPSDVRRTRVIIAGSIVFMILAGLYLGTAAPAPSPFQIDGTFSEWTSVPHYPDPVDAIPATADLVSFALHPEPADVLVYARTRGPLFEGSEPSIVFVLIDDPSLKGYHVSGMDADFIVEVYGWNATLQGTRFWAWTGGPDRDNASALQGQGDISAASVGDQLELRIPRWLLSTNSNSVLRYRIATWSAGWTDDGMIVGELPGAVAVTQSPLTDRVTGAASVVQVQFQAEGADVTIRNVTLDHTGGGIVGLPAFPFSVSAGQSRTAYIGLDPSGMGAGALATLRITTVDAVVANDTRSAPATITGPTTRVYNASVPSGFRVDGLFSEWTNVTPDPVDSLPPSADILASASALPGDGFFYVRTEGDLLAGAVLPWAPTKPVPSPPGNGTTSPPVPLPRVAAEDFLRVYVQTDNRTPVGYPIGGIYADRFLEARGRNEGITSQTLFTWNSTTRGWDRAPDVPDVALEGAQLEARMPAEFLGATYGARVVFETTDWSGASDLANVAALLAPILSAAGVQPLHGTAAQSVTATALVGTPTVDGVCSTSATEYAGASVVLATGFTFYVGSRDDTQFLYVCIQATADTTANAFDAAFLAVDQNHTGGIAPQPSDRLISVDHSQSFLVLGGTGTAWTKKSVPYDPGDVGVNQFSGGFEQYEFRIRYSDIFGNNTPIPSDTAGFAVIVQDRQTNTFYTWGSSNVDMNVPDTWGHLVLPIPEFQVPFAAVTVLVGILWYRRRRRPDLG